MTDFEDLFQPVSKMELERRKELAHYEMLVKKRRCGECNHWMRTSECPREAKGIIVSMNGFGCEHFDLDCYYVNKLAKLREVLV